MARARQYLLGMYEKSMPMTLSWEEKLTACKKAGFDWADNCIHVGFGLLKFKDGSAFSTREGNIIKLDELLERTVEPSTLPQRSVSASFSWQAMTATTKKPTKIPETSSSRI